MEGLARRKPSDKLIARVCIFGMLASLLVPVFIPGEIVMICCSVAVAALAIVREGVRGRRIWRVPEAKTFTMIAMVFLVLACVSFVASMVLIVYSQAELSYFARFCMLVFFVVYWSCEAKADGMCNKAADVQPGRS